jgi:hypothetical protein
MVEDRRQLALREAISKYRALANVLGDDPTLLRDINELVADLERELIETECPLAPRYPEKP